MVAGTFIAAVSLFALLLLERRTGAGRILATGTLGTGILALLLVPTVWALSSVLVPGHGALPSADLARLLLDKDDSSKRFPGGLAKLMGGSKLVRFLGANSQDERYLLATSSARLAAPIIISTGEPVIAMGGFHGKDPILSPEKLAQMLEANQIRFVMLGDLSVISRRLGAEEAGWHISDRVRANGKLVEPGLWRSYHRGDRLTLYDLRPEIPLVPAPSQ